MIWFSTHQWDNQRCTNHFIDIATSTSEQAILFGAAMYPVKETKKNEVVPRIQISTHINHSIYSRECVSVDED